MSTLARTTASLGQYLRPEGAVWGAVHLRSRPGIQQPAECGFPSQRRRIGRHGNCPDSPAGSVAKAAAVTFSLITRPIQRWHCRTLVDSESEAGFPFKISFCGTGERGWGNSSLVAWVTSSLLLLPFSLVSSLNRPSTASSPSRGGHPPAARIVPSPPGSGVPTTAGAQAWGPR